MNWQVAAAISEVVGAIAVIVSLIYLAFQVRQNTRALRGATLDAITNHQQDELRWSADMAPIWKKVFQSPDDLTFEESWQASEWLNAAFTARQNEYFQFRHGLLDEEVWALTTDQAGELWVGTSGGVATRQQEFWHVFGSELGLTDPRVEGVTIGESAPVPTRSLLRSASSATERTGSGAGSIFGPP